jgi:predicted nucleic acid-binding protein
VKLVVSERETGALVRFLQSFDVQASSLIVAVEVQRAVARRLPEAATQAAAILESLAYIDFDSEVAARAAGVGPPSLGSLDAIHVATALSVADDLEAFVTYDDRQAEAAQISGLGVASPE